MSMCWKENPEDRPNFQGLMVRHYLRNTWLQINLTGMYVSVKTSHNSIVGVSCNLNASKCKQKLTRDKEFTRDLTLWRSHIRSFFNLC